MTTHLADSTIEIDHRQYLDPELAVRERRAIFGRAPVVAAHGSELPNRSDFVTVQLPNNEALVVRQADRSVRAFVNTCRHRGARLVHDDAGSRKWFTCGYHGWAYAGDGSLKVVPSADTFGDVDKSCRGLVELPCEERHGLVWVVDSREGELDVADWLGGELDATFTAYGLDSYICYRSGVFDEPINWKLLMDAFVDAYHLAVTHAGSVAPHFHSNLQAFDPVGRHGHAVPPPHLDSEDPPDGAGRGSDRGPRDRRVLGHAVHGVPAPARPFPADDLPAAPERPGSLPDGDQAVGARSGADRGAAYLLGQELADSDGGDQGRGHWPQPPPAAIDGQL